MCDREQACQGTQDIPLSDGRATCWPDCGWTGPTKSPSRACRHAREGDLVGPVHPQSGQQVARPSDRGMSCVPWQACSLSHMQACVGGQRVLGFWYPLGVCAAKACRAADRHQARKAAHQPPDALFIHGMTVVLQVPCHLPDAMDGRVQELPLMVCKANHCRPMACPRAASGRGSARSCPAVRNRTTTARSRDGGTVRRPTAWDGSVRSCRAALAGAGLELS